MAKIGIRLRKNPLKSKEESPYLVTVVPNGKVGLEEILSEVAEKTSSSVQTVRLCWDAMMEIIQDELKKGNKVKTPLGLFEVAISGSSDTEDAPFDPERNKVYVKVTPSADIRNALKKLVPVRLDAPTSDLAISAVISPSLGRRGYNAIRVGEPFTVCGGGLSDEVEATLTDAKGVVHPLTVELAKDVSMTCRVDGQVEKGAAKLTVSVLGGEDGDVLFAESRKVRVV